MSIESATLEKLRIALLCAHVRASVELESIFIIYDEETKVFSFQNSISSIEPDWLRVTPAGDIDHGGTMVTRRKLGNVKAFHQDAGT